MDSWKPNIALFACENSGMRSFHEAEEHGLSLPEGMAPIQFPCGGRMDFLHILKALESGADAVILLVCHPDNCRYLKGNLRAEKRIDSLKRSFEAIGIAPERLFVIHLAAVEPARVSQHLMTSYETVRSLGPLKAGKV